MSSDHNSEQAAREAAARAKDDARESRFTFRNRAEYLMRRDLKEEAMKIHCKDQVRDFAMCAEEKGLMVVWSCQPHLKRLNACMALHNGEEAWQKYLEKHRDEFEALSHGRRL